LSHNYQLVVLISFHLVFWECHKKHTICKSLTKNWTIMSEFQVKLLSTTASLRRIVTPSVETHDIYIDEFKFKTAFHYSRLKPICYSVLFHHLSKPETDVCFYKFVNALAFSASLATSIILLSDKHMYTWRRCQTITADLRFIGRAQIYIITTSCTSCARPSNSFLRFSISLECNKYDIRNNAP